MVLVNTIIRNWVHNIINMRILNYIFILLNSIHCFSFVIPKKGINLKENTHIQKSIIDPTLIPDLTKGVVVNGFGYYSLNKSNQTSLTREGLVHSTCLGIGLMTFLGISGYTLCVSYFILGSLVTKIKFDQKKKEGIAEGNNGMRGPANVWGSAAVAMICAICTYVFSDYSDMFKIAYVSSISTKLTDTFQSEIGKAYGNTTFLITNFERVPRGTEGAISLEGTLAGFLGGFLIIIEAYKLGIIHGYDSILICLLSSQIATFFESYIGATYQDKFLNNEMVNFINTFIGAFISIILRIAL